MARILITGAGGLVGSRMAVRLRGQNEVHGTYHRKPAPPLGVPADRMHAADVSDKAAFDRLLDLVDPEVVVHCAAKTDVDGCEGHAEEARRVNVAPVERLAAWAKKRGARVLLMSTDFVFDGATPPYEVDSALNPLCDYSTSKAQAEVALRGLNGGLVLRSAVIYGLDHGHGKPNFGAWIVSELRGGRTVRIVSDQFNNPTLAEMVADFGARALERKAEGILHAASSDCLARDEFARRIAARFGLDAGLVTPVRTAELKQKAKRPARACLSMGKSEAALGLKAWSTAASLDLFYKQDQAGKAAGPQPWW